MKSKPYYYPQWNNSVSLWGTGINFLKVKVRLFMINCKIKKPQQIEFIRDIILNTSLIQSTHIDIFFFETGDMAM